MTIDKPQVNISDNCPPSKVTQARDDLLNGAWAIDLRRFPLPWSKINDMTDYFSQINSIVIAWGGKELTLSQVKFLQEYLTALQRDLAVNAKGHERLDRLRTGIHNFEERDLNSALWLYCYFEYLDPETTPETFIWPRTPEETAYILSAPARQEESFQRTMKNLRDKGAFK